MAKTLLLIDDSSTIHQVFQLIYAGGEIQVVTETDPKAALAKAGDINPDVIVVDVSLPGIDGYDLCRQLKENPGLSQTPVILMGSSFHPVDDQKVQDCGAITSITKPFSSADLKAKIEGALTGVAPIPPAAPKPEAAAAPPVTEPVGVTEGQLPPEMGEPPAVEKFDWQAFLGESQAEEKPEAVPAEEIEEIEEAELVFETESPSEDFWQEVDLEAEKEAELKKTGAEESMVEEVPPAASPEGEEELLELSEEDLVFEEIPEEVSEITEEALEAEEEEVIEGISPAEEIEVGEGEEAVKEEEAAPAAEVLETEEEIEEVSPAEAFEVEEEEEIVPPAEAVEIEEEAVEEISPAEEFEVEEVEEAIEEEEVAEEFPPAEAVEIEEEVVEEAPLAEEEVGAEEEIAPPVEAVEEMKEEVEEEEIAPVSEPLEIEEEAIVAEEIPIPVEEEEAPKTAERVEKAAISELPAEEIAEVVRRYLAGEGKDIIERVIWEVVPDLAELLIRQEIERLKEELGESES